MLPAVRPPTTGLVPFFTNPFRSGPFSPFSMLGELTEEMDRLFGLPREFSVWYPAVEMRRRNGIFRVTASLPGVRKEDLKVFAEGKALVLEGERNFKQADEEFRGKFRKEILLPEGLKAEEVTARFAEGELVVEFPYVEVKPKEIPILAGDAKA